MFPSLPYSSDTVYECPDYHTAGENSCFFNKNDTSIWVNYNITVVATNALGSTFSDPVDIDVVYIGEGKCGTFCRRKGRGVRWGEADVVPMSVTSEAQRPHEDDKKIMLVLFTQTAAQRHSEAEWLCRPAEKVNDDRI